MALGLSEDDLNGAMETDFSCDYTPEPDGITMTEWLHWVRATLAKYAAEKSAEEKKSQG